VELSGCKVFRLMLLGIVQNLSQICFIVFGAEQGSLIAKYLVVDFRLQLPLLPVLPLSQLCDLSK
jgi:hypothetical protein